MVLHFFRAITESIFVPSVIAGMYFLLGLYYINILFRNSWKFIAGQQMWKETLRKKKWHGGTKFGRSLHAFRF